MAAAADYVQVAQELYVSYFGRPADLFGLNDMTAALAASGAPTDIAGFKAAYSTNGTVKAIIDNFGNSAESTALYSGDNTAFITAIFNNVLGRDPLIGGLTYWVKALENKEMSRAEAATQILAAATKEGGSATDAATVANKVTVATNFTAAIDTAAEVNAYKGAAAASAARALLQQVDNTTVPADFQATVTATLSNLVTGNVSQTNTSLTTSADALVGGSGNDTFNSTLSGAATDTLTAFDKIDGGAGTNTLKVAATAAIAAGDIAALGLDISNVSTLTVSNTAATDLNEADTAAFSTVNVVGTAGAITLATDATTVSTTKGAVVGITADSATTVSVTGASGAVTVQDDALTTLNLTSLANAAGVVVTAAAGTRALTINTNAVAAGAAAVVVSDATATTVTINNNTAKSILDLTLTAATKLNVGGAKALELVATDIGNVTKLTVTGAGGVAGVAGVSLDVSAAADLVTIDASASSGANKLTIDAEAQSYAGGSGVDTLTIAKTATEAINGGAGTSDVLVLNGVAADAQVGDEASGFEVLGLGALADGVYDATGFTKLTHGAVAAAVTFSNVEADSTLTINANSGFATTVSLASNVGTTDALSIVVTGAATVAAGTVTAAGVETIKVTATDTADTPAAVHTLTVDAPAATKISVDGNTAITLTNTSAVKVATFDASANTTESGAGGVSYTSANITTNVSLTGGSGDDVLNASATIATKVATINGGAGDDVITGGLGLDVLDGGAGDDIITGGGKADKLTGGDGDDVFTYVLTSDSAPATYDTITDFHAKTATVDGDTIHLASAIFGGTAVVGTVSVASNGSLALAALGAAAHTANVVNIALDSSTGTLYIDGQGVAADFTPDGTADMAIILTGVTTITAAAFSFA
jgi:Ca2+-binding RTX toxin-like protein